MNMLSYENLCETANITPVFQPLDLQQFNNLHLMAEKSASERLTAALHVFLNLMLEENNPIEKIDKVLLDHFIGCIDNKIHEQLDMILHNEDFQKLESLWTSLKYVVDKTDFKANTKIEILDVDKETLREDFNDAPDITHSALYKHIYIQEYDTPGGEPIAAIISDYEFEANNNDINLLTHIARISSTTHCPFIANVGAGFFNKTSLDDVMQMDDLPNYMERAEYIRWNAFRQTEAARYIGLTLPQFLLRLPYEHEDVAGNTAKKYLWGKSSFAFATTLTRSFKDHGWTVNIRGPESGGKIENLVLHQYDVGCGLQTKIPSEILIPETRELELAQLGFIPLSYYKNSDFACFFSANSVQKPIIYDTPEATANSRINARLPYIFLSSRLGHYLKVLQRENIGSAKNKEELEAELNRWLNTLITHMNNPGPELMATHPLREGKVEVIALPDNPGTYRVNLFVMPHFQVEGIDVRLSLVAQLPAKES
ncbi:MAG TPA: type VI secretion system contractile sheath large subunit [Gammaproteobacteria bacterium]|nr:type VI secretion system contractile sheath large subunit [Gammaproteobacteria bacterium]